MDETKLNAKLVKSLAGKDMNVYKMSGSVFSRNYPDIRGDYLSISFYIEGKRAKWSRKGDRIIYKRKMEPAQFRKMEELEKKGQALCFIALYIEDENDRVKEAVLLTFDQYYPIKQTEFLARFPYKRQNFPDIHDWFRKVIQGYIFGRFAGIEVQYEGADDDGCTSDVEATEKSNN